MLRNPRLSIQQIQAKDIFEMLVQYSDTCRKLKTASGYKFYVKSQLLYDHEILKLLPTQKDKSLAGYHKRMARKYADYCLVCDELSQVASQHWGTLAEFMHDLFEKSGMPKRFSEVGLYLGNYKKTPFGVHVDGCGVLSFPVIGKKSFRVWSSETVEHYPDIKDSFEYSTFLKQSTLLNVRPGDVAYWPSTYWHIAESDGSFNATWSIGIWLEGNPHRV